MAKKTKFQWWYVYRGINSTKREIYHGVSKNPESRVNGSHCMGATKTIAHWNCTNEQISWERISKHKTQEKASEISHYHERNFKKRGYTNFKTSGI